MTQLTKRPGGRYVKNKDNEPELVSRTAQKGEAKPATSKKAVKKDD